MTLLVSNLSAELSFVVVQWEWLCVSVGDQLWRFLVTSAVGPAFWAEERTDEGELVNSESRQLGGFYDRGPPRRLRQRELADSDVAATAGVAGR